MGNCLLNVMCVVYITVSPVLYILVILFTITTIVNIILNTEDTQLR